MRTQFCNLFKKIQQHRSLKNTVHISVKTLHYIVAYSGAKFRSSEDKHQFLYTNVIDKCVRDMLAKQRLEFANVSPEKEILYDAMK
jgi:hypothetical protein